MTGMKGSVVDSLSDRNGGASSRKQAVKFETLVTGLLAARTDMLVAGTKRPKLESRSRCGNISDRN